jgi:hypothetical protein
MTEGRRTIDGAKLYVWEFHSWSCTPRNVSVHRITSSWDGNYIRWSNQPGVAAAETTVNVAKGFSSACAAGWVEFPSLGSVVRHWKDNNNNYGLQIRSPNETDNDWWKKWRTREASNVPHLDVIYTEADTTPPVISNLASGTHPNQSSWYSNNSPSLSWSGSDSSGIAGYSYLLDQSSGTVPDNTLEGSGTSTSYSNLSDGVHYFHIKAKDNAGNWSVAYHYTVRVDRSLPSDPSITSSTHTRDVCSTSSSPSFGWSASDSPSGVEGYGYVLDQSSGTVPGTSSVSTTTSQSYSNLTDGYWWMHIRAKDRAGNLSATSHFGVRLNQQPPPAPTVTSSSHSEGSWSSNRNFSISWSLSDPFGIGGYSYILDQSSGTTPDTISEGTGTSYSTSGLNDGTYYFHVRGVDGCGVWGSTRHYTVRIDGSPSTAPSVSSSSHPSESIWYQSRSATFNFSASDISGIDGYSYLVDGNPLTSPNTTSEGASTSYTASGLGDGTHYFHVRARNGSGLWSDAGHRGVKVDGTAPAAPTISSSTHPDPSLDYPNNDPSVTWTAPSDLSGIGGYSYILDQSSTTTPDTISEGLATNKSYQDLPDGVYYFHIRAYDAAGNWGTAAHRRVAIDTPAPVVVTPQMSAPPDQTDFLGRPVVKDGDTVLFGGSVTEGPGGPPDPAAMVTKCDLVVMNLGGGEVSRISVPLGSCRNVDGQLQGSFAPVSLGANQGLVAVEITVTRGSGAASKSSSPTRSDELQIDNEVPVVADAALGCLGVGEVTCDPERALVVEISEPVRGSFLPADFQVEQNSVLAATSACTSSAFCDEILLVVAGSLDVNDLPSVTYLFAAIPARTRPSDAVGHSLSDRATAARHVVGMPTVDAPADVIAPDPLDVETAVSSSALGQVMVFDDNALQSFSGDAPATCPGAFSDAVATATKGCDPAGRAKRLAKRIVSLAAAPPTQGDGAGAAADVVLLQEVRKQDVALIAAHLNNLTKLDGASCASVPRCYKVGIADESTNGNLGGTNNKVYKSDTGIIYNQRTMKLNAASAFYSNYSRGESCLPRYNALGEILFVDEDLDGLNDCSKKLAIKKHFMASLSEKITASVDIGGTRVVVGTVHLLTPSYLKRFTDPKSEAAKTFHDGIKTRWLQEAARNLHKLDPLAQMSSIAGDFNIHRCRSDVRPEPFPTAACDPYGWWTSMTGSTFGYRDSVFERTVAAGQGNGQGEMDRQYKNGVNDGKKRIDFILARSTSGLPPVNTSKNFSCGLGDTSLSSFPERLTCDYLTNRERYSDHLLLWSLLRS